MQINSKTRFAHYIFERCSYHAAPIGANFYQEGYLKMKLKLRTILVSSATAAVLAACGGGGGDAGVPPAGVPVTLGGTVAVGFPIVGAVVSVKCAGGPTVTSEPTNSVGAWHVTLSGHTFPCAAEVSGGTIDGVANTTVYHSVAIGSGILNITPLTDLIVANVVKVAAPNNWFLAIKSTDFAQFNAVALSDALKLLVRILGLTQLGTSVNPMTYAFTPVAGNVMDDTLSALRVALVNSSVTYSTLLTQASAGNNFTAPNGFAGMMGVAYAGTTSGKSTSGNGSVPTGPGASGIAANGTPALALAKCLVSYPNVYMNCASASVANFSAISMIDPKDGQTCTASYSNGTLTVTKGNLSISSLVNGEALDLISTLGTGSSETIESLSSWGLSGSNMSSAYVAWNAAGVLTAIQGAYTVLTGGGQEFSCNNP